MHPADYKGRLCGVDRDVNGTVLPSQWHVVDLVQSGVCVDGCFEEGEVDLNPKNGTDLVCKEDADVKLMEGCLGDDGVSLSDDPDVLVTCGGCMYRSGTVEVLNHCLSNSYTDVVDKVNQAATKRGLEPSTNNDGDTNYSNTKIRMASYIRRFLQDMYTAVYIVGGVGIGGSASLGLLLLVLLRYKKCIAGVFCFSAVMVPLGLGGGGVLMWFLTYDYELTTTNGLHSDSKIFCVRALGYVLWIGAALSLLFVVFRRRVVVVDILITKAAARSVREVRFSLLFPLVQLVGYVLLLGALGTWFVFLSTVGSFVEVSTEVFVGSSEITTVVWEYSSKTHYAFWFLLIVFLWTAEFILALGQLVLSLSFSEWYFTAEKDEGNNVSICRSIYTTLIRHAGTAAFGSMVIKIVRVLRAPTLFIQSRIKKTRLDNRCIDAIICSCQCCLFFLERYMKFIDRAAYVHTALFGYSFTKGSQESYYLVVRNARRMSDGLNAGWLSFAFVKMFIAVVVAAASFLLMDFMYGKELQSVVSITVVVGIISWFVGQMFIEVINMAVSTLIQCFLADEEMFGNEGSLYVPDELDEFLAQLDRGDQFEIYDKESEINDSVFDGKDKGSPTNSNTSVDA